VYPYIIIVIIASERKSSAKLLTPLSPAYKQTTRGHFEGERVRTPLPLLKSCGTHGNVVPVVKLFKNALWTALRTTVRPKCTILQDFAFKISKFSGGHTPDPAEVPPVLGPRHQFPLGSPAMPLFLFHETTTEEDTEKWTKKHESRLHASLTLPCVTRTLRPPPP